MNLYQVSIAQLFLCFLLRIFTIGGSVPTHFPGAMSINCGSSDNSAAVHGREWVGDVWPKSSSLVQVNGSSTTSTVIQKKVIPADLTVPHKTARISRSKFSYEFQLNPGQKILRLHFNPAPYKGFEGLKDLFTVEAGPFTLLGNFSASLTARALVVNSFVKEFCFYLHEDEREDVGAKVVGQKSQVYYVNYDTALEMIHRQDIMHNNGPSTEDFGHMFPTWVTQKAKKMKNNTWRIPVDVGFRYLIRLHFSELGLKIAGSDDLGFELFINDIIAQTNIYIEKGRDEHSIPWYMDYMVVMSGHKEQIRRDLVISLHSYAELVDRVGILAGFEIFKLSNPDNSLAGSNPLPMTKDSPPQTTQTVLSAIGHKHVTVKVLIVVLSLVNVIVQKLPKFWESTTKEENEPSDMAQRLGRRFSLVEMKLATRNFSNELLIGGGGFGKVYKGIIDKGETIVAVKRLKSHSKQGAREFLTEIETLSELRHINLVSLIGYCNGHGEMILVYDYVAGGTLADHLYKFPRESNNGSSLTWKQRLNICIGSARGLDYLHTGCGVIHRDVKSSNILLDENFIAKVSDFGLAKQGNKTKLDSYVSSKVKGTRGYCDPHYIYTGKLTRKSDTYAFGVLLLEILCERPAVDTRVAEEEQILTKWVRENISMGKLNQIVSSSLRGEVSEDCLRAFMEIVKRCLHDEPKKRPTMAEVLLKLESLLEQQDSKQILGLKKIARVADDNIDDLLINAGKPTVAPTGLQNLTPPPIEQTNVEVVYGEPPSRTKDRRKFTMYKSSRLWLWGAFRNRIKPSKKNELALTEIHEESWEANIRVAKFYWHTVAVATNQFSLSNKVGQGGFGAVYKAILPTGQVVAVKRLSSASCPEEFKNEILLLPNLQHENIVKLLGYCIHKEEKLMVYEFLENGSLDTFIGAKSQHLQWAVRFKIIMGIARGVAYLHQYSRPSVIHRDLKLSNILLDANMNPIIGDFGIARTLEEHQSEMVTARIAGTCGYMSPEYAMEGKLSLKLDVYIFGITVLAIVSGRRNPNYFAGREYASLGGVAWKLWNEGKALDLVDESLGDAFPVQEALRCIQVALLCVEELPQERPAMPLVLKMLEGNEKLVEPRNPWFARVPLRECSSGSSVRTCCWTRYLCNTMTRRKDS